MHDLSFEQEAVSRLGGLGMVRLDKLAQRRSGGQPEVEIKQGRVTVLCSPEVSNTLLQEEEGLVPNMWEFRRVREMPSTRYRPTATLPRLRDSRTILYIGVYIPVPA